MKLNHFIGEEELMAFLDGESSPERAVATAAHLAECSECQRLSEEFAGVSKMLTSWKVEPGLVRMTPAMQKELGKKRRGFRIPVWAWAAVATGIVIIIALPRFKPAPQEISQEAKAALASESRGTEELALAQKRVENFAQPSPIPRQTEAAVAAKPMIARSAQLALVAKAIEKVRTGIDEVLRRHNGYLGDLHSGTEPGTTPSFQATLHVPASQFEAAFAELKNLGQVESETQSGEEVTQEAVDLDARLANARNSERRLTDLLQNRTGRLEDVLSVETEIERVRGEIERMDAEKKTLTARINFATINVKVREAPKAQVTLPAALGDRFRDAAVDGFRDMIGGVVSVLTFLLSWGPSLLLFGAIAFFPARFAWRQWRRLQAAHKSV